MYKKVVYLFCFSFIFAACSFNTQTKKQADTLLLNKAKSFAEVSSVFKIDLDEKLGENSNLLLFINYDKETASYQIKIIGAFASVLLKANYNLNTFTYDFEPELMQNKQVKELFEQTIKVLLNKEYKDKYLCAKNKCELELGSKMFRNKYTFSSYEEEGFAKDILCSYRRGTVKINLVLLKVY